MNFKTSISTLVLALGLTALGVQAQDWSMKKAVIMTSFSNDIDTANVLGEYPRPQMERNEWKNLNGIWQFREASSTEKTVPTGTLGKRILVPFACESAISGIMQHFENMWYKRYITIPATWSGQRILLHFDAVDYESEVFVNGVSVISHKGGYDPFTIDITDQLTMSGPQELAVKVSDPTDKQGQPRGKQTLYPGGIMYTATSGIWQSVWMEPVPATYMSDIKIVPDIDNEILNLEVTTQGPASGVKAMVEVFDNGNLVNSLEIAVNSNRQISVPNPKLWSPDSPFLYDLKIKLKTGETMTDSLKSYFGMRKSSLEQVGKYKKMMLNNEFLFQFGPLDQGFWPDGLYTPPTDEAIKNDINKVKQLGWNMIRKHIKVEPYRWYYWADKLGVLVWQDMPSSNSYTNNPQPIDTLQFRHELERMVRTHWNSPCITTWVPFNEGQGQDQINTKNMVDLIASLDSTRLINEASGGWNVGTGDIFDIHSYPPPACPSSSTRALACGEYGGIGYTVQNHIWRDGNTYVMVENTQDLYNMYEKFGEQLIQYKTNSGMSAAVYTELTDVEAELNGILTYDRKIVKGSLSAYHKLNQRVINQNIYYTDILPTSEETAQLWKYTKTQPAADWYKTDFNDNSWFSGSGGFGVAFTPGVKVRTVWNTSDIWIRKNFNLGPLTSTDLDSLVLKIHHDEDCDVYINGVLATSLSGYTTSYMTYPLSEESKAALIPGAINKIAIHCHQTSGGQYIDAGIGIISYEKKRFPLEVKTTAANNSCKLVPNPTKGIVNIERLDPSTKMIGIYDLSGSEVMKLKQECTSMDISRLNAGLYFVKATTGDMAETMTLIKI